VENFLKKLPKIKLTPEAYRKIPESAGIYVFFNTGSPIYIGKAINLKRRVSSYFDIHLGQKTARMMKDATELSFVRVDSELEALLLEARLIRQFMPKYNIAAKDDKHPLYIQITKEKYPRIITARKTSENQKNLAFYGPFPSARNVRSVLGMLRRIFPYSDHKLGRRRCLYSHLGLCNPCPNLISVMKNEKSRKDEERKYYGHIRKIKSILDGNISKLKRSLVKSMKIASARQEYEIAGEIRNQIHRIEYITRPQMPTEFYMENPNLYEDTKVRELKELKKFLAKGKLKVRKLERIECFDVAHLGGTHPTASMVTFIRGEADKNYYRHFRIRQKRGNSDIDSLKEVMSRRLKHVEDWGIPDLIIVDGGVAQVRAFTSILESQKTYVPVIGIAKNPDRLIIGDQKFNIQGTGLNLVLKIRDEAHRFARRYHHKLISRSLINRNL